MAVDIVLPQHPVVALFNAKPAVIYDRLCNDIASVCGCPLNSSSVWGFDVVCLGPADCRRPPIRLMVKVKRDSSLGRDWNTCSRLARTCYKALQDLGGFADVHCLVVEADLHVAHGTDSASPAPAPDPSLLATSFVPFKLDRSTWASTALSRQSLLCMTNKIGQPITTLHRPSVCGSSGVFIQLSGPNPDHPAVGAKTFLLTNRHVVCDNSDNMDITDVSHPSPSAPAPSASALASNVPPAEPIYVIQPGPRRSRALKEELENEINTRARFIREIESRSDAMPDENDTSNTLYARYKQELPLLESYREHCLAHESPASQVIGTVAYSRALGTRDEFRIDWALISCEADADAGTGTSTGTGKSPYNNSCCIFDLSNHIVRDALVEQVDPPFAVTVDNCADGLRSVLHFITLSTVFSRIAVERHYLMPKVSMLDAAEAAAEDEDDQGDKAKFLVYKYGAATGSTYGILNSILSLHVDDAGFKHKNYCIIGPRTEFSKRGDSGSAVFGLLPPPPGPSSMHSLRPVSVGGEGQDKACSSSSSSPHAADDLDKPNKHRTPGIVGLIWGGHIPNNFRPHQDLTFATPFDVILKDIEEFTGRKDLSLSLW